MIDVATKKQAMLSRLETFTGCVLVPANTTKQLPAYPFITFNIINTGSNKGTYSKHSEVVNGVTTHYLYNPTTQTWSFTVQSDDDAEALQKALLIKDFFELSATNELADNDIVVASVGNITPRDTLLTIEYEYRKGLDVVLNLNNIIADTSTEQINEITLTEIFNETSNEIIIEKER